MQCMISRSCLENERLKEVAKLSAYAFAELAQALTGIHFSEFLK